MRLECDAYVADVDSRRQQEGLHKERVEARLPPVRAVYAPQLTPLQQRQQRLYRLYHLTYLVV
jgi:hypothetical protein